MSKSDLSLIEAAIRKNIRRHFSSDQPYFIIGVSGGVDSMSLLHAFHKLDIPGLVSHINYQKRGAASDKDAELVEKLAFEWGFVCHTVTVDPEEAKGHNFQQWARNFRYEVFLELAREHNADGIAVAHHEDDQVETILQKIFRGAGLVSWTGMDVWDGTIFRPFLHVSRSQIEQYASENVIPFRTDESNLESDFARNFLRNEWVKKVSGFFPGWKQNVLRINQQAGNYEAAIDWIAGRILDGDGINRQVFHSLDQGVQKAVLLYLLKRKNPDIQISRNSLAQLEQVEGLQTGREIQLSDQFSVLRDRDRYVIMDHGQNDFEPEEITRTSLESGDYQNEMFSLIYHEFEHTDYKRALYLDSQKIKWPLTVRRWKDGDRFQPFGMKGHQPVSDHLTNRKVSAALKKQALVIESFDKTICAVIFPPIKNLSQPGTISELVKCDFQTEYCLEIRHKT